MNTSPLVSIAMPVFNGSKTLSIAVRSILLQTYENWELLLIDDGSTDSTLSVAHCFSDPRIKVIANGENKGHGPRLNQAIHLSQGKYIARMDQDDICFPERLERQVAFLEMNPEVDLLGAGALVFGDDGNVKGDFFGVKESHEEICKHPWVGFYLPHPTWMGRTEWFKKFYYCGNDLIRAEDQDLLLRSYDSSRYACLPEILLGYRLNSLSINNAFLGRLSLVKSIIREAFRTEKYAHIVLGVITQLAKGLLDVIIILFGLERPLVKNRANPSNDMLLLLPRWRQVWDACHR